MKLRSTLMAAALALASFNAAEAQTLGPIQSQTIDLGDLYGVAYYTVESDGFHVVATLAQQGEDGAPVRVETVLAPNQKVTFSTPRRVGAAPDAFEISRRNDEVLVRKAALIN